MARFKLFPPDHARSDLQPFIIQNTNDWPEGARGLLAWLVEARLASTYTVADEVCEALSGHPNGDVAAAVERLGEPAARSFIANLKTPKVDQ